MMAALALGAVAAQAQEPEPDAVTWQSAVAELAAERTRAETCVSLLKRHAAEDPDAISRGQWAYADAKADMDGVIGALVVALARDEEPVSFDELEPQLERAVSLREEFCTDALALVPETDEGTKFAITDILGKAIGSMVTAAKDIYIYHQEEDVLVRQTIQTQVEATQWRDFAEIAP